VLIIITRPDLPPDTHRPPAWTALNAAFDAAERTTTRLPSQQRQPHTCNYVARFIAGDFPLCSTNLSCASCSHNVTRTVLTDAPRMGARPSHFRGVFNPSAHGGKVAHYATLGGEYA